MNEIQGPTSSTLGIDSLPAELLAHIFTFLDENAPSDVRLHDQPDADMLRGPDPLSHHLKTVSLINRQWRATVLPLLFRNVVWYLDRLDLMQVEQSMSPSAVPLLSFIRNKNLTPYVKSLTMVIASAHPGGSGDIGIYRRGDGSGHYGYSPEPLSPSLHRGERNIIFNEDTNWLWKLLFDVISPLRFTMIASPRMLASLLSRMLFLGDEWIFSQTHHILSLSRDDPRIPRPVVRRKYNNKETGTDMLTPSASPISMPSSSFTRPSTPRVPCALFTLQPWTSVLLNEGSSTQVYKTYEYFHRRPPSLLGALLGAEAFPNDVALLPATIQTLSYVGIFPLADHMRLLVENLPRIERLFVQLVPRNDILKDRRQMKGLDMDDLWAERDSAYAHIISRIRGGVSQDNWRYLREFESGDVADEEAWGLVGQILASPEWNLIREGVFERQQD